MRRLALIVLLTSLAGCGGGGDESEDASAGDPPAGASKQGLSMSVSFTEPLRTGQPVTWTLEVENGGPSEVTLVFGSGKEGDVMLTQGGKEAYRWSGARYFTQAMRQVRLAAGEKKAFTLEEHALSAAAGDYELVAELDSEPAPQPIRRSVKIES